MKVFFAEELDIPARSRDPEFVFRDPLPYHEHMKRYGSEKGWYDGPRNPFYKSPIDDTIVFFLQARVRMAIRNFMLGLGTQNKIKEEVFELKLILRNMDLTAQEQFETRNTHRLMLNRHKIDFWYGEDQHDLRKVG